MNTQKVDLKAIAESLAGRVETLERKMDILLKYGPIRIRE